MGVCGKSEIWIPFVFSYILFLVWKERRIGFRWFIHQVDGSEGSPP